MAMNITTRQQKVLDAVVRRAGSGWAALSIKRLHRDTGVHNLSSVVEKLCAVGRLQKIPGVGAKPSQYRALPPPPSEESALEMPKPTGRTWWTCAEAAAQAEVSSPTIGKWCLKYSLGRRVGGRWRVDRAALAKFLSAAPPMERPGRANGA